MAGIVFTVAQQKGGAGKTTLAAHLAVANLQAKKSVALIDIDPQGSLSRWAGLRDENRTASGLSADIEHRRIAGWRTEREVEALAKEYDVVIVDSAPHAEMETKAAIRAASLILIPVQPSPLDLWATEPTLSLARAEKRKALLILNRVPARAKLAETIGEAVAKLEGTVAKTTLGNRIGLAGAMTDGRAITETQPRSVGAAEIHALAKEVLKKAKA